MKMQNWKRIGLGVAAAGVGTAVWAALWWGNRYLDKFEDTTREETACGEFFTTSAGWRIHFTVQGSGSPVVLIHGFLDSLHTWRRNIEILARNHTVYAIDVLGFGASERVTDPIYTLKQQAGFLNEFFQALDIARADLVGHSMGGALALQFAYDFPVQVHKLVLIAPATYIYNALPRKAMRPVPRTVTRGVLGIYEKLQGDTPNPVRFAYGDPELITEDSVVTRNRMMRVQGMHDALISMTKSKREADVPNGLDKVNVPTLIVWGRRDRVVPPSHARRHMQALPQARLEWIESAGHLPHEEQPDSVNLLVSEFLDQSST